MRRTAAFLTFAFLLTALAPVAVAQAVIYVDASAGGAGNGTSWQDAYTSPQDALAAASAGDAIWVAAGTYTAHADDRTVSFDLVDGVRLHGGFAGTESSLGERDPALHPTILSGDLAADDDGFSMRDENAYHVVRAENVGDNTLLESFVIHAGHANGVDADSLGGGLLISGGSPAVMNTEFVGNYGRCGGGVAVTDGGSPELANVVINGNRALRGGGICSVDSTPSIVNATITANTADAGAGLFNRNASPSLANSIVSGNGRPGDIPECELIRYPCTIAAMTEDARSQTMHVLAGAVAARQSRSLDDAVAYLENHEAVVDIAADFQAVRFRIRGGTPTWLTDGTVPNSQTSKSLQLVSPGQDSSLDIRKLYADVVGEDTNDDGHVDNRDSKRALVLGPFMWDLKVDDESGGVARAMEELPAYADHVQLVVNEDSLAGTVTLQHYESWNDYDLVYLSGHGARVCRDGGLFEEATCTIELNTNIFKREEESERKPGVQFGYHFASDTPFDVDYVEYFLEDSFFRHTYGGSLDNAMVILSACETGGAFANTLARALGRDGFVMMGWSESIGNNDANIAMLRFVLLLRRGLSAEEALEQLESEDLRTFSYPDGPDAELMRYAPSGGDQRLIEVIGLENLNGPLRNGDAVEVVRKDGTDRLNLIARLDGVTDANRQDFKIRIELDGEPIGDVYDLSDASQVDEYGYLVELNEVDSGSLLELEFYELSAIAELPEGGESRFRVDTIIRRCFWEVEMGGSRSGTYRGTSAGFRRPEGQLVLGLGGFGEPGPEDPLVHVSAFVSTDVPVGSAGPYELGYHQAGVGFAQVAFLDGVSPNLYLTGDGSEIGDFVLPDPSTLSLTRHTEEVIEGSIQGDLWAQTDPDGKEHESANVSIRFRAEPAELPDGSPNPDMCGLE